jgi:hypothetical protein
MSYKRYDYNPNSNIDYNILKNQLKFIKFNTKSKKNEKTKPVNTNDYTITFDKYNEEKYKKIIMNYIGEFIKINKNYEFKLDNIYKEFVEKLENKELKTLFDKFIEKIYNTKKKQPNVTRKKRPNVNLNKLKLQVNNKAEETDTTETDIARQAEAEKVRQAEAEQVRQAEERNKKK